MSDLAVMLDSDGMRSAKDPLESLQDQYPNPKPTGSSWTFPWGRVAVLKNQFRGFAPFESEQGQLLVVLGKPVLRELPSTAATEPRPDPASSGTFRIYQAIQKLGLHALGNLLYGEYALFLISRQSSVVQVLTDSSSTINVYYAWDPQGRLTCVSSHPSVTAALTDGSHDLDPVSAADFLINERVVHPYTLYSRVREFLPASSIQIELGQPHHSPNALQQSHYWTPRFTGDAEFKMSVADWGELIREQISQCLQDAVLQSNRIGVLLSGGLDSRVILSGIPHTKEILGFTVYDQINQTTDIAKELCRRVGARWVPLQRSPEYYGDAAPVSVRLSGGDPCFIDAHFVGARTQISQENVDVLIGGYLANVHLGGYYSTEKVKFMGMNLPFSRAAQLPQGPMDYEGAAAAVGNLRAASLLHPHILDEVQKRNWQKYNEIAPYRLDGTASEWMEIWPGRQNLMNVSAHRRLFPKIEPFADFRLLKIAATTPTHIKAGGHQYRKALMPLLGGLGDIPMAGFRVPLTSSPLVLSMDLMEQKFRKKLARLFHAGKPPQPTVSSGSWINREAFWKNSQVLAHHRSQFSQSVQPFWNSFMARGYDDVWNARLSVFTKFRLFQLCLWHSLEQQRECVTT